MQHQQSRILWSPRRQGDTWEGKQRWVFLVYGGKRTRFKEPHILFCQPSFSVKRRILALNVKTRSNQHPKGGKLGIDVLYQDWRTIKLRAGVIFATLEWKGWQIECARGTCEQISWLIRWDNLTQRWPADMCHSNEVTAGNSVSEHTTLTTKSRKKHLFKNTAGISMTWPNYLLKQQFACIIWIGFIHWLDFMYFLMYFLMYVFLFYFL